RVARVSWNRIRPRVMEPRARRCDGGILERPCVPGGCPLEGARMSVRILILACAAALAACGASEPAQAPQAPTAARREAPPRYIGLWAVSQAMCESPAWRFRTHEVATLGEVHCEFVDVAAMGDSYEIS